MKCLGKAPPKKVSGQYMKTCMQKEHYRLALLELAEELEFAASCLDTKPEFKKYIILKIQQARTSAGEKVK